MIGHWAVQWLMVQERDKVLSCPRNVSIWIRTLSLASPLLWSMGRKAHSVLSATKSLEKAQWSRAFSNGTFPAVIQSFPTRCCLLQAAGGWSEESTFVSAWSCQSAKPTGLQALRIAQQKKPHNIGEKLILPCCKNIVRCMIGDGAKRKLAPEPLSNNTIQRRISEMAEDIKQQVVCGTSCTTQNVCNPAEWVTRCS